METFVLYSGLYCHYHHIICSGNRVVHNVQDAIDQMKSLFHERFGHMFDKHITVMYFFSFILYIPFLWYYHLEKYSQICIILFYFRKPSLQLSDEKRSIYHFFLFVNVIDVFFLLLFVDHIHDFNIIFRIFLAMLAQYHVGTISWDWDPRTLLYRLFSRSLEFWFSIYEINIFMFFIWFICVLCLIVSWFFSNVSWIVSQFCCLVSDSLS